MPPTISTPCTQEQFRRDPNKVSQPQDRLKAIGVAIAWPPVRRDTYAATKAYWAAVPSISIAGQRAVRSNSDMSAQDKLTALSLEDYQDYEFVLTDIEQQLGLSVTEQIDRFRSDPWGAINGLRAPDGRQIPLSRDANKRLGQIARRGMQNLGPSARIHRPERVIEELTREFSSLLFSGLVPAPEDAHELFVAAVRKLEQAYESVTYYVPCSVVAERSYPMFAIGPVSFVLRERFFTEHETALQAAIAEFEHREAMEPLAARMRSFYSGFQWIASITVPPCDPEISRRRAHVCIQKALDVFKLAVGGERARHVKQAYDLTPPSDFAELIAASPGKFRLTFGWGGHDALRTIIGTTSLKAGPLGIFWGPCS